MGGSGMSDKLSEVYECYDMTVISTGKGRGMNIVKTDKGIRALQPLSMSESRLAKEIELLSAVAAAGYPNVDSCICNRDGDYITYDRYHTPYILKHYYEGRECNIRTETDMVKAVDNLAELHIAMEKVERIPLENESMCKPLYTMERRNRELQRVRNYIRKKPSKSEFEYLYLSCFDQYYNQGWQVHTAMKEDPELKQYARLSYCHGTYNQHNVLILKDGMATVNFDHYSVDHPITDLYTFIRKAMEKNEYQMELLVRLLETYTTKYPFEKQDYRLLYYLLWFPEKFWKISNQYNNMNKAWTSPKMQEKLQTVIEQECKKQKLLSVYYKQYC